MLLHAFLFEENGWHIAQCLEIDVASQGNVQEESLANLKEALTLHFQAPVNTQPSAYLQEHKTDESLSNPVQKVAFVLDVLSIEGYLKEQEADCEN